MLKGGEKMKKIIISIIAVLSIAFVFTGCSKREMENTESKVESSINSGVDKVESGINSITDNTNSDTDASHSAKISEKKAKETALKHAKLSETDISDLEIELERDNGKLIYEITFDTKSTEYDYHIDANTGDIISSKKEKRD